MFPRLTDKSFVKQKPNLGIFSPYKKDVRESLNINQTAINILKLCDGTKNVDEIAQELHKNYYYNEDELVVKKILKIF